MQYVRRSIIACAVMRDELTAVCHETDKLTFLDYGLHNEPDRLRKEIQREIDAAEPCDAVLLGFGCCGNAVVGVRARRQPVVIPKVDDCIAMFLGSRDAYEAERRRAPGTYYLTKGWIEHGSDALKDYPEWVAKYGPRRAKRLLDVTYRGYSRVGLIATGIYDVGLFVDYAARLAELLDVRCEVIQGSMRLFRRLAQNDWEEDCLVLAPGEEITRSLFWHGM